MDSSASAGRKWHSLSPWRYLSWRGFSALFVCLVLNSAGLARQQEAGAPLSATTAQDSEDQTKAEGNSNSGSRGSFIIAPLPISSPALGTGIVPILGYIFPLRKSDTVSPPSVVGAAGLVTNNGSRGFAAYADLFIKQDTYRITSAYLRGNINYNLYGIGISEARQGLKLPLEQSGQVFRGEFLRRLGWDLFVGLRVWSGNSEVTRRSGGGTSSEPAPPADLGLHTNLRALGLRVNRDTTPNRFYPTAGAILDFTSDFFAESLGSKYSFQAYRFTFNKYWSFGSPHVLAYNLFICGIGGKPPFYGNCIYGANNELRGYTAGQYLDRYMYATQLEYRLSLPWRFGVVGFGGIGEVVPGGSQLLRIRNVLPAAGGGIRFQLSKAYRVNLRADIAKGRDTWTWGMGVGEAF